MYQRPPFSRRTYAVLARVSSGCPPLQGRFLRVTHPSATRQPPSKLDAAAVRLACVKHAASVQSEPGSNSSLQNFLAPQLNHRSLHSITSRPIHPDVSRSRTLFRLGSRFNACTQQTSPRAPTQKSCNLIVKDLPPNPSTSNSTQIQENAHSTPQSLSVKYSFRAQPQQHPAQSR